MGRRSLLLGACCSFLAGIGATAVAAYVAEGVMRMQRHRLQLRMVTPPPKPGRELEQDLKEARKEARDGINHVRSLLRAPRVSESDRETDRKAAQEWVRKMMEMD